MARAEIRTGGKPVVALELLRFVSALLFMQHGLQKVFMWPASAHHPDPVPLLSLFGVGGLIEVVGGLCLLIGLFTRPVAFVLCGQMAAAYWLFHFRAGLAMPDGWMPVVNQGDSAIQFCFTFLYFALAQPGPWTVDANWRRRNQA